MSPKLAPRRALAVLDILGAVAVLAMLNGFAFGNSDDLSFLPWVYRWDDSSLYLNDLRFGEWPKPYYSFHLAYMIILAKLAPIGWGLIATSMLSQALLVYAMRRLAQMLVATYVPAVIFAVLVSGYYNAHLTGGYHLLSQNFSTHYPAIAGILLSVSLLLEGRWKPAAAILAPVLIVNPRLGAIGAVLLIFLWWLTAELTRRLRLTIAAGGLGVSALVLIVAWAIGRGDAALEGIVRAWMFARAPWHFAPASWGAFVFVNLALVSVMLLVTGLQPRSSPARTMSALGLACVAVVTVTIFHNLNFATPLLVLANPFQLGTFPLAICYVLLGVGLIKRMEAGGLLSSLLVLALPDLQSKLLAYLTALLLDKLPRKPVTIANHASRRWDVIAAISQVCVLLSWHLATQPAWRQIDYGSSGRLAAALAAAMLVVWLLLMFTRTVGPGSIAWVAALVIVAIAWVSGRQAAILNRSNPDASTAELCRFVAANTERDAVFIVPPGQVGFQADCRRPAFFVFAHLPLRIEAIPEWIRRLQMLRLVPNDMDLTKLTAPIVVNYADFENLKTADVLQIVKRYPSVRFALTAAGMHLDLPVVFRNDSYTLYELGRAR